MELYQFPESRYGLAVSASTAGTLLASLFLIRGGPPPPLEHLRALFLVNSALMAALVWPRPFCVPFKALLCLFTFQLLIGWLTACINNPLISFKPGTAGTAGAVSLPLPVCLLLRDTDPLGISYTEPGHNWLGPGAAYACNNLCVIVLVLL